MSAEPCLFVVCLFFAFFSRMYDLKEYERYRRELKEFLEEFAWLHCGVNTRVIRDCVFRQIPSDWRDSICSFSAEELNMLADGQLPHTATESLLSFVNRANRLNLFKRPQLMKYLEIKKFGVKDCPPWRKGLKPKKAHEVGQIFHFFSENFNPEAVVVFDVGSGKDYVGEALTFLGFEVVSIEYDPSKRARRTQEHPLMTHIDFRLLRSEDSVSRFVGIVEALSGVRGKKACLTTLHGCGDLSPTIIQAYGRLPTDVRGGLLVLSCCYHLCSLPPPASKLSSETEINPTLPSVDRFLVPPCTVASLRLAAQDSPSNWLLCDWTQKEHVAHAKRFVFRAVLESLAERHSLSIVRSSVIQKNEPMCYDDFGSYFDSFSERYEAVGVGGVREKLPLAWRSDGENYLKDHAEIFAVAEGFTALQYCIQPVLESSVLYERLRFLQRPALPCDESYLIKLFDEKVSPRCWGIVSLPQS